MLFGYTDQSIDPRESTGPDDPRMQNYSGVLPGFRPVLHIPDDHQVWLDWLAERGYTGLGGGYDALGTEPARPAELGVSAFLTDHAIDWLREQATPEQRTPWFAHLSYLRPHPPYGAAGEYSTMYDPADVALPIAPPDDRLPFHDRVLSSWSAAPTDEREMRELRAQYYGMISEVDAQLARLWQTLRELDMWDDTMVIVTADHGEQLGDQGLLGKLGWFEESYHILGIVRDPRHAEAHGSVVESLTENVDLFPTICEFDRRRRAGAVRRPAAHPVPARRATAVVARARPLGVRLARPVPRRRRTRGRGTSGSNASSSPASATPTVRTCSSATARGAASTWRPTPRGTPSSPTRRGCCPTCRRWCRGGRCTPTAPTPGCWWRWAASAGSPSGR